MICTSPSGLARNTLLRTRTTRPWMAQETPKDCEGWSIKAVKNQQKMIASQLGGSSKISSIHINTLCKSLGMVWFHSANLIWSPRNFFGGFAYIIVSSNLSHGSSGDPWFWYTNPYRIWWHLWVRWSWKRINKQHLFTMTCWHLFTNLQVTGNWWVASEQQYSIFM